MSNSKLPEKYSTQPAVSLVIPTFNRSRMLVEAIKSCVEPKLSIEVVVVDDGSTDDTPSILQEAFGIRMSERTTSGSPYGGGVGAWRGMTITYLAKPNGGASSARNVGLSCVTGKYVKFLDSDDRLLPGALVREVNEADKMNADVLVTGWIDEYLPDKHVQSIPRRVERPVPDISNGIDDMLLGKGPLTSTALYRRSSIENLRWDETVPKAEEWLWAWTVCLAGARFVSLPIPSIVYVHHREKRVTGAEDAFYESTRWRQHILAFVEKRLNDQHALNTRRKRLLSHYYYKDARVLCEYDRKAWKELASHIRELDPSFRPAESQKSVVALMELFGLYRGVCAYVFLKRLARAVGFTRPNPKYAS